MTDLEKLIELFKSFGLHESVDFEEANNCPGGGYFIDKAQLEHGEVICVNLVEEYRYLSYCEHDRMFEFNLDGSFNRQYSA